MTYRVKGTLKLPDGSPAANCEIEFVSRKNLSPTVQGSKTNILTSATGYYDVTLELGEYAVIIYAGSTYPSQAGVIVVLADTTPGQDLPTLLSNGELLPTTPDYMQQIQAWLVAANEAADDSAASSVASESSAQAAAASAATTAAAVTDHESKPDAHPISGVSGLQTALNSKEESGTAAATMLAHKEDSDAHEIGQISGLTDALASLGGGGGGGFAGQSRNLSVTVSGVGYQGSVTAERLVVESSFFAASTLRDISLTFDGAASGAGGIDTGTVSNGNWYYIYVIYDGSTAAVIISLSDSTPTLPVGYTKFAKVGEALSSSGSFIASVRTGNRVIYGTKINPSYLLAIDGVTPQTTERFEVGLSSFVPPSANMAIVRFYRNNSSADGGALLYQSAAAQFPVLTAEQSASLSYPDVPTIGVDLYSSSLFYRTTVAFGPAVYLHIVGYAD